MRTNSLLRMLTLGSLLIGGCSKKSDDAPPAAPATTADVKFYRPASTSSSNVNLQMTIISGKLQFSTLGRFSGTHPQPAVAAFVYDGESNKQSIVLFDAQQQPAFVYGVDAASGQRKPELVEFMRVNPTTTIIRLYHYNWATRLGTLLLETRAVQTGAGYEFTKLFENANPGFAGRSAPGAVGAKVNESFPAPVLGLDLAERKLATPNPELVAGGAGVQARGLDDVDAEEYLHAGLSAGIGQIQQMLNYVSAHAGPVAAVAGTLALLGLATPVTGTVAVAAGVLTLVSHANSLVMGLAQSILNGHGSGGANPGSDSSLDLDVNGNPTRIHLTGYDGYNFDVRDHVQQALANALASTQSQLSSLVNTWRTQTSDPSDLDDLPDATGVLQFGLTWDTATDIDLWVTDPSGVKIYYANRTSPAGGYLDRDDTDGFGPENVYYRANIRDGNYLVQANYYGPSGGPATQATVSVSNGLGFSRSRTLPLGTRGATGTAFTVRKIGATLTVQ